MRLSFSTPTIDDTVDMRDTETVGVVSHLQPMGLNAIGFLFPPTVTLSVGTKDLCSHLSPFVAFDLIIAMNVEHSHSSSTNG